jgi:hypothetical protein
MSTIDLLNNHSVVEYTAGVTKPFGGQRLSVLYWKTGKDGIKKESKCVSIPMITGISDTQLQAMIPHVIDLLATAQNKIIRELVEEGKSTILGENISIDACIKYLEEVGSDSNSQRLTSELLGSWYDEVLEAPVMLAISNKLGIGDDVTEEQANKVEAISKKYKETIGKLASGSFKLPLDYAEMVKKVISMAPENDAIASKLIVKLDKMNSKTDDLLMAL